MRSGGGGEAPAARPASAQQCTLPPRGCRCLPCRPPRRPAGAQGKEGVKGRHWFTEPDLKAGACLRPDKTGRALITVLRHLGRIQEARPALQRASRWRPPCVAPVYSLRSRSCTPPAWPEVYNTAARHGWCVLTPVCRGAGAVEPGG
jgi:hypothetical protein